MRTLVVVLGLALPLTADAGDREDAAKLDLAHKFDQAFTLYEKACAAGDGVACTRAGQMLERGRGRHVDLPAAIDHYAKACTAGDGAGCYFHGASDDGLKDDFSRGCELGSYNACSSLAHDVEFQGAKAKAATMRARALELVTKACAGGDFSACHEQLFLTSDDKTVPHTTIAALATRASELAQRACDAGDRVGCSTLEVVAELAASATFNVCLDKAKGSDGVDRCRQARAADKAVAAASARATTALEKDCAADDANACYQLGDSHPELKKKACAAGVKRACPHASR